MQPNPTQLSTALQRALDNKPDRLPTVRVTLNARYLKAASMVASKDKKRPHLNAVLVEVNKLQTHYVATNGSAMVALTCDAYPPENYEAPFHFLVPLHVVKLLDNMLMKKRGEDGGIFSSHVMAHRNVAGELVFCSIAGGTSADLSEVVCREAEVFYPDWRKGIPSRSQLGAPVTELVANWVACQQLENAWHVAGGVGMLPLQIGDNGGSAMASGWNGAFTGVVSLHGLPTEPAEAGEDDAGDDA